MVYKQLKLCCILAETYAYIGKKAKIITLSQQPSKIRQKIEFSEKGALPNILIDQKVGFYTYRQPRTKGKTGVFQF